MLRWLFYLFILSICGIGFAWLFKHDGTIDIAWLGYQTSLSVSVAIILLVLVITVTMMLLYSAYWIWTIPKRYLKRREKVHHSKGLLALTEGFAALSVGDTKQAQQCTKKATSYLGQLPITQLLAAQSAQMAGKQELAHHHYETLLEHHETKDVALKGMLLQARQNGDVHQAIFLAEKALRDEPSLAWPVPILLELYKRSERWNDLEQLLPKVLKHQLMTMDEADHLLGIVYFMQSIALLSQGATEEANQKALDAYKRNKHHIPTLLHYTARLAAQDHTKKAIKLIEQQYEECPHPLLAKALLEYVQSEPTDKKRKRFERLLHYAPNDAALHSIIANLYLASSDYKQAHDHLQTALSVHETPELCQLMAQLAQYEHSSPAVVEQWLERAKRATPYPLWQCSTCETQPAAWEPNCAQCNDFNSLTPVMARQIATV